MATLSLHRISIAPAAASACRRRMAARMCPDKNAPFPRRVGFAGAGIRRTFRTERSFRVQLGFAGAAAGAVALLRPGLAWAALVLLSAALVLALELANAALEAA